MEVEGDDGFDTPRGACGCVGGNSACGCGYVGGPFVAASEATALATPLAALEATAPVAAAAQRMWLRWRQRGPWLPRRWLEDA